VCKFVIFVGVWCLLFLNAPAGTLPQTYAQLPAATSGQSTELLTLHLPWGLAPLSTGIGVVNGPYVIGAARIKFVKANHLVTVRAVLA